MAAENVAYGSSERKQVSSPIPFFEGLTVDVGSKRYVERLNKRGIYPLRTNHEEALATGDTLAGFIAVADGRVTMVGLSQEDPYHVLVAEITSGTARVMATTTQEALNNLATVFGLEDKEAKRRGEKTWSINAGLWNATSEYGVDGFNVSVAITRWMNERQSSNSEQYTSPEIASAMAGQLLTLVNTSLRIPENPVKGFMVHTRRKRQTRYEHLLGLRQFLNGFRPINIAESLNRHIEGSPWKSDGRKIIPLRHIKNYPADNIVANFGKPFEPNYPDEADSYAKKLAMEMMTENEDPTPAESPMATDKDIADILNNTGEIADASGSGEPYAVAIPNYRERSSHTDALSPEETAAKSRLEDTLNQMSGPLSREHMNPQLIKGAILRISSPLKYRQEMRSNNLDPIRWINIKPLGLGGFSLRVVTLDGYFFIERPSDSRSSNTQGLVFKFKENGKPIAIEDSKMLQITLGILRHAADMLGIHYYEVFEPILFPEPEIVPPTKKQTSPDRPFTLTSGRPTRRRQETNDRDWLL